MSKLAYLMLCRSIRLLALLARGDAHKDLEILVLHHQLTRQRPRFWARQVRGLLLLVVFAVGLAATSLLTWLGSYGGKAAAVALANLAAAAAVNVGLFLLAFRVLTPQQIPTRQLVAGALVAGVAWQALQAVGGYLVGHYLRHTSQVYGVFAIVLGLLFWLYLGARLTLYAAELNVVAARQLWPRSVLQPLLAADQHTQKANPAMPLLVADHQEDLAAPQSPTSGQHGDVAGDDAPTGL